MNVKEYDGSIENPGWEWKEKEGVFGNPNVGEVQHVIVCSGEGKSLWDQYRINEREGVVAVPFKIEKGTIKVGLIGVARPVADLELSLEFPRGFIKKSEEYDKTAIRKIKEEAGQIARDITFIGNTNINTSFYGRCVPVFAAKVVGVTESDDPQVVKDILWCTETEMKKMMREIKCGVTKAAWAMFQAEFL